MHEAHVLLCSYPLPSEKDRKCELGVKAPAADVTDLEKAQRRAGSVVDTTTIR